MSGIPCVWCGTDLTVEEWRNWAGEPYGAGLPPWCLPCIEGEDRRISDEELPESETRYFKTLGELNNA
jgi:hypothetical protein